ncbi:MAG: ribokinase [Spirochaetaceae bacterium]|jgi:ribokinase|nr:ribokinase [Spirochaetaceae bacterium]
MKVLVYGSINIDLTFMVDHIAKAGETIGSISIERSAGGKGANQAASLAKAGMPVYLAGKIGQDGRFLLDLLQSYGVNTDNVVEYEGSTGQALIQIDRNKQNAIVVYSGGNGKITTEEIERTIVQFGAGDLLLFQNEIIHTEELMQAAKKQGVKICINPSPYDKQVEALPLDMADIFFVNELEGMGMAGVPADTPYQAVMDALVKRFPDSEILLTAGKDGAYYGYRNIRERGTIMDVPVVDTVGAGDTFTGYYLAARYRNYPVAKALDIACRAASIAVSRKGAMEAIPFASEVFD